jgi:hypothetical protein
VAAGAIEFTGAVTMAHDENPLNLFKKGGGFIEAAAFGYRLFYRLSAAGRCCLNEKN